MNWLKADLSWKLNWKTIYEIVIAFFVLTYGILLIQNSFDAIPDYLTQENMNWIDYALIWFFAIEYSIRFMFAKEKWKFVKSHWFDLISMIPFDAFFRIARLMRLIRLIRLIKMSSVLSAFFRSKEVKFSLIIVAGIVFWGASGVYLIEGRVNSSLQSFVDAIWWAIVTTTTVGYGDISPVTIGGRVIAVILMFTGIGLIGSVTASVATHFIQYLDRTDADDHDNKVRGDLVQLVKEKVSSIHQLNEQEYRQLLLTLELLRTQPSNDLPHEKKE
ncbi:ion transporter [Hazenella coriacea]|nr:ion transporter [Hazenella coriacea]